MRLPLVGRFQRTLAHRRKIAAAACGRRRPATASSLRQLWRTS